MTNSISIGIIGDFNPEKPSHIATDAALKHAADFLSLDVKPEWLGTGNLRRKSVKDTIGQYQGLFAAPGTPYFFADGAIKGIKLAREMKHPLSGHLRWVSIRSPRIRPQRCRHDECRTHRTRPEDGYAIADKNHLRRG